MKREEFYIAAAPIFATYLGVTSGNEALKYTSFNTAELDQEESRRLFVASLLPSPSSRLIEDREEVVRLFGYALAQEEAGVDRNVLVHTFLDSMKTLAVSKTQARVEMYESIYSALGALFLTPLFLLFLWAVGVFVVEPWVLYALLFTIVTAVGAVAIIVAPRDLDFWKTYGISIPIGLSAAVVLATTAAPAAFLGVGAATYLWLWAKGRLWWFSIRGEVAPLLRSVAAMLREGAPPDLIMARLSDKFYIASKLAYGYLIPSRYFVLAKSMYKAITEAGGAAAIKAVEYIQSVVDIETASVRKMVKLAAAYFALYLTAVFILAVAASTAVKSLAEAEAVVAFFTPPPYEEVRHVVATSLSLIAASFIAVFLTPLGVHKSATLGGAVGLAIHLALLWIL
ncbi:MAG: hypothetical protein QXT27_00655 [Pyrobaculum sp.]